MKSKKPIFSSLFLFLAIVGYLSYYNFYVLPKDMKKYEELMKKKTSSEPSLPKTTMQLRQNVQKDIWQEDDGNRLHHKIFAKESTLFLTKQNSKTTIKDHMKIISCLIQEQLFDTQKEPMQEIRRFEADSGVYDFEEKKFKAEKVLLSFISQKGTDLPKEKDLKKPFLKGIAKEVSFAFSKKGPNFHAEKFKAELIPEEAPSL